MANVTIPQLPAAAALAGPEPFETVQSNVSVRTSASALATYILGLVPSAPTGGNPTAVAGASAVNGTASTFMRSDGAPAIAKASSAQFGICQVDNSTITASGGVISAANGSTPHNPTATAGPAAVNGSAATFMRSDAAPAVQLGTASVPGIVQVDNVTITAAAGVISAPGSGATGANPTATAGASAVNGSALSFMRSDGAPAVAKASSSVFGIVEVDGTTILSASGVISAVAQGLVLSSQGGSSYSFVLGDANQYISFTGTCTATVQPNGTVAFPVGTTLTLEQSGSGAVTISAGAGVTINSAGNLFKTNGQWAVVELVKKATNTWTLFGNLAA